MIAFVNLTANWSQLMRVLLTLSRLSHKRFNRFNWLMSDFLLYGRSIWRSGDEGKEGKEFGWVSITPAREIWRSGDERRDYAYSRLFILPKWFFTESFSIKDYLMETNDNLTKK
jgi:hypothetical protein